MALSDLWTLAQLDSAVRLELGDPNAKWWTETEIQKYLNDWQELLQTQFEFAWNTATITNSAVTVTLASFAPDMMRLDAIYYTPGGTDTWTGRLSPRTLIDLDFLQQDWRAVTTATGNQPEIAYQYDSLTVSFWPPPPQLGTYIFEYPVTATFSTTTSTTIVPAWCRYSAINYCCYRAFARAGPNQNTQKAQRYKRLWEIDLRRIRNFFNAYFPEKAEMLRPGRKWNSNILRPRGIKR